MKPLIGLNLDVNVQKPTELRVARTYCTAIESVGCVPVFLPPMSDSSLKPALSRMKGVVLIGGRDYSPSNYGDDVSTLIAELHPDRQDFDQRLARHALAADLPILGICGGMQLLNIVLGGTLYQDIPSQYPVQTVLHRSRESEAAARHPVKLVRNSKLAKAYRRLTIPEVVSSHHQCFKRLGKGVEIVGTSTDGLPEAFELAGKSFVIGVQWHPERDLAANMRLFRAFARQARMRN